MNERDFFNEKEEVKKATYSCPHCRERAEYDVRWLKRTKKPQPPRGMNEQDRARFQKSRDYMVRIDDMLACRNARCRGVLRSELTVSSCSSDSSGSSKKLTIVGIRSNKQKPVVRNRLKNGGVCVAVTHSA
jgi:hypothetical protein